jgi:hypothetical protein
MPFSNAGVSVSICQVVRLCTCLYAHWRQGYRQHSPCGGSVWRWWRRRFDRRVATDCLSPAAHGRGSDGYNAANAGTARALIRTAVLRAGPGARHGGRENSRRPDRSRAAPARRRRSWPGPRATLPITGWRSDASTPGWRARTGVAGIGDHPDHLEAGIIGRGSGRRGVTERWPVRMLQDSCHADEGRCAVRWGRARPGTPARTSGSRPRPAARHPHRRPKKPRPWRNGRPMVCK